MQRFHLIESVREYVEDGFKTNTANLNCTKQFLVGQEVTGTTDKFRLHFCLTNLSEKFLFGHTANKLSAKSDSDLESLAVFLNSKLLDWLFRKTSTNNHVMGYEIAQLPIPHGSKEFTKTLKTYYWLLNFGHSKSIMGTEQIENTMDSLVFNLYFPDHMKERGIDVIALVEQDMENALQGREFHSLEDEEKEKVINQLHTTWSDPGNEVVRRMGQFKEKSPEILKVILES